MNRRQRAALLMDLAFEIERIPAAITASMTQSATIDGYAGFAIDMATAKPMIVNLIRAIAVEGIPDMHRHYGDPAELFAELRAWREQRSSENWQLT